MKKLSFIILSLFLLSGCNLTNQPTSNIVPGEKNTALIAEQQKQIDDLKKQNTALEDKAVAVKTESSKAASSVVATLESSKYVEPPLVREAISEESKVALSRLPEPDPAEKVRALERMMLIITGQRDEALKKYAEVSKEVAAAKKAIDEKEAAIAAAQKKLDDRDITIAQLKKDAAEESEKAKLDHAAEIKKIREEYENKERATWILWVRIASLVLIVGGAVLLAVFKMATEGGSLIAAGTIIGVVSIFVTWLTAQWWFPWLMGLVLLAVMIAGGRAIYNLYKRKVLHEKLTAAMQDLKDESTTLGNDVWEKTSDHIKYRIGDKDSPLGKAQKKIVKQLGLD